MVGNGLTAGANWVASSAVRAENRGVGVELLKRDTSAGVRTLVSTVKDVVDLVGGVANITPKKGGRDCCLLVMRCLRWYPMEITH